MPVARWASIQGEVNAKFSLSARQTQGFVAWASFQWWLIGVLSFSLNGLRNEMGEMGVKKIAWDGVEVS